MQKPITKIRGKAGSYGSLPIVRHMQNGEIKYVNPHLATYNRSFSPCSLCGALVSSGHGVKFKNGGRAHRQCQNKFLLMQKNAQSIKELHEEYLTEGTVRPIKSIMGRPTAKGKFHEDEDVERIILINPRKPKIRIPLEKGALTKGMALKPDQRFFDLPEEIRHQQYIKLAKKYGEKDVYSKLNALTVMNKPGNPRRNKDAYEKAGKDRTWVSEHFEGKKMIKNPVALEHIENGKPFLHILETNPQKSRVTDLTGGKPKSYLVDKYNVAIGKDKMIHDVMHSNPKKTTTAKSETSFKKHPRKIMKLGYAKKTVPLAKYTKTGGIELQGRESI